MSSPRSVRRSALTFQVRRRSLSPARQAAFDDWIDRWGLDLEGPALSWPEVFGRDGDVVLDIGFGHGESTIRLAADQRELDVIAVEVHTPGVATVLDAIEHQELHHLRVVHGNVLPFLDRIPAASLAVVRIFFPDPWPKARTRHRRLVGGDVVAALTDRLRVGGAIQLATDIDDYADTMQEVCDAEPRLEGGVIPRPDWRPLTRFEQRGLDAGRSVTDLRYVRRH